MGRLGSWIVRVKLQERLCQLFHIGSSQSPPFLAGEFVVSMQGSDGSDCLLALIIELVIVLTEVGGLRIIIVELALLTSGREVFAVANTRPVFFKLNLGSSLIDRNVLIG